MRVLLHPIVYGCDIGLRYFVVYLEQDLSIRPHDKRISSGICFALVFDRDAKCLRDYAFGIADEALWGLFFLLKTGER